MINQHSKLISETCKSKTETYFFTLALYARRQRPDADVLTWPQNRERLFSTPEMFLEFT